MEKRTPVFLSSEQKVAIIKEHLLNHVPVSDLCNKYQLAPSVYWNWQKTLLENGVRILDRKKNTTVENTKVRKAEERIQQLEAKLKQKNDVIAELMQEHFELKKKLNGET